MSITITISFDTAFEARKAMADLLGSPFQPTTGQVFERGGPIQQNVRALNADYHAASNASAVTTVDTAAAGDVRHPAVTTVDTAAAGDVRHPAAGPVTPGREPGKAGPGRQRRTKAEIEEDERYPNGFGVASANISSGADDRVNPDDQEQGAEDNADEEADGVEDMDPDDQGTAEAAAETPAEPVRTKDDLRKIVGQFGKLFQNDMLGVELAVQPAFKAAGVENISGCPADKIDAVFAGMIKIGKQLEDNPDMIAEISAKAKAAAGVAG